METFMILITIYSACLTIFIGSCSVAIFYLGIKRVGAIRRNLHYCDNLAVNLKSLLLGISSDVKEANENMYLIRKSVETMLEKTGHEVIEIQEDTIDLGAMRKEKEMFVSYTDEINKKNEKKRDYIIDNPYKEV